MILSAQTIRERGIITPFYERSVRGGKTYGLSAAGYDVRAVFKMGNTLRFRAPPAFNGYQYSKGHTFSLASTMEHFQMPLDVMGVVHDKSSWARKGLTVQNTVIEPGWCGWLTLELVYHGKDELLVNFGDPIAQIVFHQLDKPTEQPYAGKYQNQEYGPQEAREETS